jgi:hypothetical protein
MKLLIHIGPDTLACEYRTKRVAKDCIKKKLKRPIKKPTQAGDLVYKFQGRIYCKAEMESAVILTPMEYWKACKEAY